MKKTMNKTTKNNFINYGIVIAIFVIVADPFRNRKPLKTSYRSAGSALRLYDCGNLSEPGCRFFR